MVSGWAATAAHPPLSPCGAGDRTAHHEPRATQPSRRAADYRGDDYRNDARPGRIDQAGDRRSLPADRLRRQRSTGGTEAPAASARPRRSRPRSRRRARATPRREAAAMAAPTEARARSWRQRPSAQIRPPAWLGPPGCPTAPAPIATTAGARIVAAAETQIGQAEQPPGSNESPAIAEYRAATAGAVPGAPWCAYFASWAARQAGEPIGADGAGLGSVSEIWSWAQSTRPGDTQRPRCGAPARRSDRVRRRARRHRPRRTAQRADLDDRGQLRKQGRGQRPQPGRSDRLREHELSRGSAFAHPPVEQDHVPDGHPIRTASGRTSVRTDPVRKLEAMTAARLGILTS